MTLDSARVEGFTLVEVLVALIVSSLLLAIVLDGASTGRRRAHVAEEKRLAVLLSDSLLTEAAVKPLGDAPAKGTTNHLSWTVDESVIGSDPRGMFALAVLTATISDGRGHRLFAGELRRIKPMAAQ